MKQQMKRLLGVFSLAALTLITITVVKNNVEAQTTSNSDVNLSVSGGTITINAPTSGIVLGSVSLASTAQDLSGKYAGGIDTGNYRVEDLNGYSGWLVTIQASSLTGLTNTGYAITGGNVAMSGDTVYTYAGQDLGTDNANITGLVKTGYTNIGSAVTFMQRPVATNTGLVGKYRVQPRLKVTVPAYTPAQSYQGTITITLQ